MRRALDLDEKHLDLIGEIDERLRSRGDCSGLDGDSIRIGFAAAVGQKPRGTQARIEARTALPRRKRDQIVRAAEYGSSIWTGRRQRASDNGLVIACHEA